MKQASNSRRSRGRGNGKRQPNRNSNYDSGGTEGRIRGNASQVHEKYLALARDALSADDRIASENYYQHAEHFYRILHANTDGQVQKEDALPKYLPAGIVGGKCDDQDALPHQSLKQAWGNQYPDDMFVLTMHSRNNVRSCAKPYAILNNKTKINANCKTLGG